MDRELYAATIEGNIESLHTLIQNDSLILDRTVAITPSLENPLHIAAMCGQQRFAAELLRIKPGLASELDWQCASPLHLAAFKGHAGIVKDLVQADPSMCFTCNRDGRNPLHVAAMMGRVDAMKEILRMEPDAALALVNRSESILHLCVEYSRLEALELLLEANVASELINSKDRYGNSILHLCVNKKQVEIMKLLLSVNGVEVNALNLNQMTAMDILIQRRMDTRDVQMESSLKHAGALGSKESIDPPTIFHLQSDMNRSLFTFPCHGNIHKNVSEKKVKSTDDWLDKKKSTIMIVATLIANMAFQLGVNPPKEVWDKKDGPSNLQNYKGIQYYLTIIYVYLRKYAQFYMVNTTGFIASLSIIFLLMSGLPLRHKAFMWILMVILWVAITAIALTYTVMVIKLTPSTEETTIDSTVGITVFVWICLMALLLFGHTIRILFKMIKVLTKPLMPKRRKLERHLRV